MHRSIISLKSYAPYLFLLIITLASVFLRFYKLGEWGFWVDEVFSFGTKMDGFIPSLTTRLIHSTTALLGVNEWSARLVPALVGVVTIPALYFFVAPLFGNSVGLISCALLAVSTWHIYWSQNARFYVLMLLFYSLALFSFYMGLEKDRPWLLFLSLVFLGLAAQERMLALMLLPVILSYLLMIFILPFDKPPGLNFRNLAIYFVPGAIVASLISGPFLRNLGGWMVGFARINNNPFWLFSGFVYYVGFPVICMAVFSAIYLLIKKDRAGLFFGMAAIIPILIIMVFSLIQYSANRYFFIALTSWILLASLGTQQLIQTQKGETRLLAVGILVLLLGASLSEDYLYYRYQNGNRDNWRAALELIKDREKEGDLIFVSDPDLGNYYLGHKTLRFEEFKESIFTENDHRVWFVVDMTIEELFPYPLAWIEEHASRVENFDVVVRGRIFIMRVYLYDPAGET